MNELIKWLKEKKLRHMDEMAHSSDNGDDIQAFMLWGKIECIEEIIEFVKKIKE